MPLGPGRSGAVLVLDFASAWRVLAALAVLVRVLSLVVAIVLPPSHWGHAARCGHWVLVSMLWDWGRRVLGFAPQRLDGDAPQRRLSPSAQYTKIHGSEP